MACDLTTTLANACTSGIGNVQDRTQLLRIWAQLLCDVASFLILDDGINPKTIIENPTGAYDYTGEAWVSVQVINGTGITSLVFGDNPDLTSITITGTPALPILTLTNTSIVTLDLSGQTEFNELTVEQNDLLTSIDLSSLDHTDGDLLLDANDILESLDVSALVYVSGGIFLNDEPLLTTISFPLLQSFSGEFRMYGNPALTSISLPSLTGSTSGTAGGVLDAPGSPALTSFVIPAVWPFIDNFTVDLSSAALDLTSVNLILTSAYASSPAITASTIDVADGTSAPPAVGAPLNDALALIAAGNTVSYNAV